MSRSEHRDRWDRRSVGSIAFLTLVPMLIAILAPIAQAAKPGALDRSFGHNGKVTTNFGHYNTALAAAIDGHGRIVAVGSDFDLARYRRNGELDHTFSDDGKVTGGGYDDALAVAIDSHGRIVVAGSSEECNFSSPYSSFVLARYKSNGSPDPSFDPATTTFTGYPCASANSVAIDSHGADRGRRRRGWPSVARLLRFRAGSLQAQWQPRPLVRRRRPGDDRFPWRGRPGQRGGDRLPR